MHNHLNGGKVILLIVSKRAGDMDSRSGHPRKQCGPCTNGEDARARADGRTDKTRTRPRLLLRVVRREALHGDAA